MKISAVIPVYNGEKFIIEAINSVLNQTKKPIELIIVDDGSTDGSEFILKDIKSETIEIKIIKTENGGQSRARNLGVNISKGDYIAFLDQDDVWYENHLEILSKPFYNCNNIGWVYSDLDECDKNGLIITKNFLSTLPIKHPKKKLADLLSNDMFILPSASLINKKAFLSVGGFDERLSGYEDDDLFLRMFRNGFDNYFIPKALSKWRIYNESTSYSYRMAKSRRIYAEKLINNFPDDYFMGRNWVRDCIAPRFYNNAISQYLLLNDMKKYNQCKEIYPDIIIYNRLLKNSIYRKTKVKIMKYPALYYLLRKIKSR
ncbi:glycosyltransferase family 2 protein [Alicyclobacillus tolerans]|uniref:glycosyltransferase family 2 protein n=1 Tax=Alicyclobacillus tolerans TaxID=90970 RepID=UPI003B7D355B